MQHVYDDMSQLNQRWHNALPLTGLGAAPMLRYTGGIFSGNTIGTTNGLGDYYDGGFVAAINASKAASANANQNAAMAKKQANSVAAIPLIRAAIQFVNQAFSWVSKAQEELQKTHWASETPGWAGSSPGAAADQGVAEGAYQSAVNAANAARNNVDGAAAYVATLPKPALPKAFTDAIAAAIAEGQLASAGAILVRKQKTFQAALVTLQQQLPHCDAGLQHLNEASAIFQSIDWSVEMSDEEDAIAQGNAAAGVVTQGCGDLAQAGGYVNSLKPPAEITPVPVPVVHTCPSGQIWTGSECATAFPSSQTCPENQVWDTTYQACMWKQAPQTEASMWMFGLLGAAALGFGAWLLTRKKGR